MANLNNLIKIFAKGNPTIENTVLSRIAENKINPNILEQVFNRVKQGQIIIPRHINYEPAILTTPKRSPRTFNGLPIETILSPKGGKVKSKFFTGQGSEYILTEDGFARRIKPPHANDVSQQGLHGWNKGATRFTDSNELGWAYQAWTDRTKPLGFQEKDGIITLMTKDAGKWRPVMRSEVRPSAVSKGLVEESPLQTAYTTYPQINKHLLEYGTNNLGEINWFHNGSPVSHIEFKKGGRLIPKKLRSTSEKLEIVKQTKQFKRGGTIQNEIILYHNCPKSALNSILKNGIKASYSVNKNNLTHKEIADKVDKIPKVVYLGSKRMADGIGAYRKKYGYANDEGVTLELKIPKKDFDNFKIIQNPECLGASNVNEYIKIRKNKDLNISEKEIRQRWKVINPPYTITVVNDIDPKYIVNKFKKEVL